MTPRQPILKFAFVASAFIYMFVAWIVSRGPAVPSAEALALSQKMAYVLTGVYMLTVALSPLLLSRQPKGSNGRMILALGLYESGAIYGFMLSHLSHNPNYAYSFGGAAAVLMMVLA